MPHAELESLDGRKYYGTYVNIFDDCGDSVGSVVIWLSPHREEDYIASERQGGKDYEVSDNHYECDLAYRIAKALVDKVNEV
jgi:hypothetical protein